jgi:lysyl endopeptidase
MSNKLFFILILIAFSSAAQQGDGGMPKSYKLIGDSKSLDKISFEQPDIALLKAEDLLTEEAGSAPWRFGFNNNCAVSLSNSGTWTVLPNGNKIWRLLVHCEKALTVNLTFKNVSIPEGNELFVYNPDKSFVLGKFTAYQKHRIRDSNSWIQAIS